MFIIIELFRGLLATTLGQGLNELTDSSPDILRSLTR